MCYFVFAINFEAAKKFPIRLFFADTFFFYYREKQKLRKTGNLEILENVIFGKFFISELKKYRKFSYNIFYQGLKL